MKTYRGYRLHMRGHSGEVLSSYCVVHVVQACEDGAKPRPLNPRLDLANKSPTGFEWGYAGSGPAQLALALVADAAGDAFAVPAIYQRVKAKLVGRLAEDGWTLTEQQVCAAVDAAAQEAAARPDAGPHHPERDSA